RVAAGSWARAGTLSQVGMAALTSDGATLIASSTAGEVATSGDGSSWTWKGAIGQLSLTALGVDTPATTGVAPPEPGAALALRSPSPNPARIGGTVALSFSLAAPQRVTLTIFDSLGRRIAARPAEAFGAGRGQILWRIPASASGLYLLVLDTGSGAKASARLVVVK